MKNPIRFSIVFTLSLVFLSCGSAPRPSVLLDGPSSAIHSREGLEGNRSYRLSWIGGTRLKEVCSLAAASDEDLEAYCRRHRYFRDAEALGASDLDAYAGFLAASLSQRGLKTRTAADDRLVLLGCMGDSVYIEVLAYRGSGTLPFAVFDYRFRSYAEFIEGARGYFDLIAADIQASIGGEGD